MKFYKYTLLKQDGTKKEMSVGPKLSFDEMYRILHCITIEIIPQAYYPRELGKCTIYGDEEARFNSKNTRNPHMLVLKGNPDIGEPAEWDVVGDLIMEENAK